MKQDLFNLKHYDYSLPPELIAQEPASPRDASRLLVIDREKDALHECIFRDIVDLLRPGDCLVLNDTKVIKARLWARRQSGARLEVLLLRENEEGCWQALVNPARRARVGERIFFDGSLSALISGDTPQGGRILKFSSPHVLEYAAGIGKVPLPPYIKKESDNLPQYQTVYAREQGAVAAPTAGLHFTKSLLAKIKAKGVDVVYITLHCGLSTFRPVKTADIREHPMGEERVNIPGASADKINSAKSSRRRVIAVGTTAVRSLEAAAVPEKDVWKVKPFCADTNLYLTPGYKFKIVDALVTNFHTPCSTNLILAACFCGNILLKQAYDYARENKFRFYSFGDATFIV